MIESFEIAQTIVSPSSSVAPKSVLTSAPPLNLSPSNVNSITSSRTSESVPVVPPSPTQVALNVGSAIAIIAATIVVVVGLSALAWRLFTSVQRDATGSQKFAGFSDRQIRAIQSNGALGALILLVILGVIWMPLNPALQEHGAWITGEFIEIGVMLTAGFFGFLFGLPHFNLGPIASLRQADGTVSNGIASSGQAAFGGAVFLPSTNLEKVADNVAGLIAGAALAQLITVPSYIGAFAEFFSRDLGLGDAGKPLGAGLILFFAPLGFVLAYIATRTIGARAFAQSDTALLGTGSHVVDELPVLPDVQADPTPDQRAVAARIVAVSLASLQKVSDKRTWARAQSVLENWKAAEMAYQQVVVLDDGDPGVLLDYATVLYNDLAYLDYTYIFQLIDRLIAILDIKDDNELRSRALALRAGTNLYVPGGNYITAITTVNDVINNQKLRATPTLRFYRACAFGQLYRGYKASSAIALGDAVSESIKQIVERDVAITLTFGSEYKEQVQVVLDPIVRTKGGYLAIDDDLQQLAIDDPVLLHMTGSSTPPPPDPSTLPDKLTVPSQYASVQNLIMDCPI